MGVEQLWWSRLQTFQNQIRSTGGSQRCSGQNEVEAKLNSICIDMVGLKAILFEIFSTVRQSPSITIKQELKYTTQEKLEKIFKLE